MLKSDAVHWHVRWVVGFLCKFIAWVVESSESRGERRGCGKVVRAPGRKTHAIRMRCHGIRDLSLMMIPDQAVTLPQSILILILLLSFSFLMRSRCLSLSTLGYQSKVPPSNTRFNPYHPNCLQQAPLHYTQAPKSPPHTRSACYPNSPTDAPH